MPMIATTIISSINVKPLYSWFILKQPNELVFGQRCSSSNSHASQFREKGTHLSRYPLITPPLQVTILVSRCRFGHRQGNKKGHPKVPFRRTRTELAAAGAGQVFLVEV